MFTQTGEDQPRSWGVSVLVRDDVLVTPTVTSGILEGIARASVLELASLMPSVAVLEREVDRTELHVADEAFFSGSHFGILPIARVDRIGLNPDAPGPVTRAI
jgi:branched-chain amino acid aminotransferase